MRADDGLGREAVNFWSARVVAGTVAASLAGCFGSPALAPQHLGGAGSWMDRSAKSTALLYVADRGADAVNVYSYPEAQRKGTLTGFRRVEGLCVDRAGDVWVVDSLASTLYEYAHGGAQPIATLSDPNDEHPWTCSVNPKNGDLAVANIRRGSDDPGGLSVFTGAQGKPRTYFDPSIFQMISVSYDSHSNIFVAGVPYARPPFVFAELRHRRKKFVGIALVGVRIKSPGGLQFADGKLAIGEDQGKTIIYRFSGGTITGITSLLGACHVAQFFIDGPTLVASSICEHTLPSVLFYSYPTGGHPIKRFSGLRHPFGVAVSNVYNM
jgi:hypothetical protein